MKLNKLGVIVGAVCFGAGLFVMHGAALTIPALFGLVAYVVVAWRLPDTWGQRQMVQQAPQMPMKKAKKVAVPVQEEEEPEEDTDAPIAAPKKKDTGMKLMGTVDPNDPDSYRRIIKKEKDIAPKMLNAKHEVKVNKPKKRKPMNSGSGGSAVTGL